MFTTSCYNLTLKWDISMCKLSTYVQHTCMCLHAHHMACMHACIGACTPHGMHACIGACTPHGMHACMYWGMHTTWHACMYWGMHTTWHACTPHGMHACMYWSMHTTWHACIYWRRAWKKNCAYGHNNYGFDPTPPRPVSVPVNTHFLNETLTLPHHAPPLTA